jgi:ribosome-binding protein aMBF1 (putative translation factor)
MDAGLSVQELADRVGYTKDHLGKCERGRLTPGEPLVRALAEVFGKRPSELEDALRRELATKVA